MHFTEYTSIVQTAVSPVILISGVGLLILSMTNRFGRVLDRSRQHADTLLTAPEAEKMRVKPQLKILLKRARLLRVAITFATLSALLAAILVIALFSTAFFHAEAVLLNAALFILCLVSLILSLLTFLMDINLSLSALKLELGQKSDHTA